VGEHRSAADRRTKVQAAKIYGAVVRGSNPRTTQNGCPASTVSKLTESNDAGNCFAALEVRSGNPARLSVERKLAPRKWMRWPVESWNPGGPSLRRCLRTMPRNGRRVSNLENLCVGITFAESNDNRPTYRQTTAQPVGDCFKCLGKCA